MKALVWGVFVVLAALWSGLVAIGGAVLSALAQWLGSGQAGDLASAAAQIPVPAWLALWVDVEWWMAVQSALVDGVAVLGAWLPSLGAVAAWLVPLAWVVWALGLLALLVVAGLAHWGLARWGSAEPPKGRTAAQA